MNGKCSLIPRGLRVPPDLKDKFRPFKLWNHFTNLKNSLPSKLVQGRRSLHSLNHFYMADYGCEHNNARKKRSASKEGEQVFFVNNVLPSSFIFDQNFRNTTVDVYFYLSLFLFPFKTQIRQWMFFTQQIAKHTVKWVKSQTRKGEAVQGAT